MYGIFTNMNHKNQPTNQPNVGKYTSPMDPWGKGIAVGIPRHPPGPQKTGTDEETPCPSQRLGRDFDLMNL